MCSFTLNGKTIDLNQPSISYEEIDALMGGVRGSILTVTFRHPDGSNGSLVASQSTSIEDGPVINAILTAQS